MAHPLEVKVVSKRFEIPGANTLQGYLAAGGFEGLKKALAMEPGAVVDEVKKSGLRGRGGAGFPTGLKWSFVPKVDKPKFVLCNCDESEPGTCKDRLIVERDPFSIIEGMIIAGRAIGAGQGYIFIRGEYRYLFDIMERAIAEAYAGGYLGKNILGSGMDFDLAPHTGAGAYECGEESALMESLEGKRGIPRLKPPFPAVSGFMACPTVINNAETLATVPHVLVGGSEWYANFGPPKNGGTRLVCLSGLVKNPGVFEIPLGFPMQKLIEEMGGGLLPGRTLKAVVPGGSSTPILTAEEAMQVNLDYDSIAKAGSMAGSGGVVVLDNTVCMVKFAVRIMQFYRHESCGWCVPCREGTNWLHLTLQRFHAGNGRDKDIDLINQVASNILGHTHCPLGDAAAMPTLAIVKKFRKEFEDHLSGRPCEWEHCALAAAH